jgi:predicted outer membrane repeat protein
MLRQFRKWAWCAVLAGVASASAWAGNAVVSTCDQTHFQTALTTANTAPGGTITFTCSGTITLTTNLSPDFVDNNVAMVIDGGNAIILDGGNTYSFWQVYSGGNLTLKRLTLQHGGITGNSNPLNPIQSFGALTLDAVTVKNNSPASGVIDVENGSATFVGSTFSSNTPSYSVIYSHSSVSVQGSTFTGNSIPSGGGAAIRNLGGTAVVNGSSFSGNSSGFGGAISNDFGGGLYVSNSTFTSNSALDGGAIENSNSTPGTVAHVVHSTFTNNTAGYGAAIENFGGGTLNAYYDTFTTNTASNIGGAIWNEAGVVNANWSTFTGNTAATMGGAVACDGDSLYVSNSTFSGNKSNQGSASFSNHGGAIYSGCYTVVSQATFYNNAAPGSEGGGVYMAGNQYAGVFASTFASNQAQEGAAFSSSDTYVNGLQLSQSIVSGNTAGHSCSGGPFTSSGYNLADDTACGGALSAVTDNSNVTLTMGALASNGGPTQTMLPAAGNPAINHVPNAQCLYTTDQRGALRPTPTGGSCDSGAVEVGGIIDAIFKDGFELP